MFIIASGGSAATGFPVVLTKLLVNLLGVVLGCVTTDGDEVLMPSLFSSLLPKDMVLLLGATVAEVVSWFKIGNGDDV